MVNEPNAETPAATTDVEEQSSTVPVDETAASGAVVGTWRRGRSAGALFSIAIREESVRLQL